MSDQLTRKERGAPGATVAGSGLRRNSLESVTVVDTPPGVPVSVARRVVSAIEEVSSLLDLSTIESVAKLETSKELPREPVLSQDRAGRCRVGGSKSGIGDRGSLERSEVSLNRGRDEARDFKTTPARACPCPGSRRELPRRKLEERYRRQRKSRAFWISRLSRACEARDLKGTPARACPYPGSRRELPRRRLAVLCHPRRKSRADWISRLSRARRSSRLQRNSLESVTVVDTPPGVPA